MSDDYRRSKEAFLRVLDAASGERDKVLHAACGGDESLRARVERLLLAHEESSPSLAEAPIQAAVAALPADEAGPLQSGDSFSSYTIMRSLGAGAMGMVYEAVQDRTARRVALKIVRPALGGSEAHRRFLDEGRALARLQHPGIAQVYEARIADLRGSPTPYIAMELVDGEPLAEHARDLPVAARLELVARLADATHHAHLRGVIHRDLKPANVLVTEQGEPKILDFGIAKIVAEDVRSDRTRIGEIIGTPAYMSPEQKDGNTESIDHRTDVFALGVILRELVFPHAADAPLRGVRGRLRGEIDIIIRCATDPDRERRYASAEALADDLRRHLSMRPILAKRPSRVYIGLRFVQRNRTTVIFAAIALIAAVAGGVGILVNAHDARRSAALAAARFDDVRALARSMLFSVHDELILIPGSTAARRQLVATASEFLDRLSADPSADDALRCEMGQAYIRLGDALGYHYAPNLGDIQGALDAYDRGLALLVTLPPAVLQAPEAQFALACGLIHRTSVLMYERQEAGEVRREVEDGRKMLEALLAEDPTDSVVVAEVIRSAQRYAMLHKYPDEVHEKLRLLEAADALAVEVSREATSSPAILAGRADIHNWIGYTRFELGLAEGVEASEQALEFCRLTLEQAPGDPQARYIRASVLGNLSKWYASAGQREEALSNSQESLKSIRSLSNDDALDLRSFRSRGVLEDFAGDVRMDLARAALRAGHTEVAKNDLRLALQHFQTHLDILNQRRDRGWLYPWEGAYPDEAANDIDACKAMLADLP